MANFDTSNNHNAKIRYLDTGNYLVVEWKDVYLQVISPDLGSVTSFYPCFFIIFNTVPIYLNKSVLELKFTRHRTYRCRTVL